MKRIHRVLQLVGALLFLRCSVQPQAASQKPTLARIELTETDLFDVGSWVSTQVSVMGFHVGISWSDVLATAQAQKLQLRVQGTPGLEQACTGKGRCEVLDPTGQPTSTFITFGKTHEISEPSVEKIFEGASPLAEKNQVSLHFKGATFSLFNRYSKDLRLKLLGPETSSKKDRYYGFKTFSYPRLGVDLTISTCATKALEDPCSDLTVSFVQPAR